MLTNRISKQSQSPIGYAPMYIRFLRSLIHWPIIGSWIRQYTTKIVTVHNYIYSNKITAPIKILHFTDLHIDRNEDILPHLVKRIQQTKHDFVVITGDFQDQYIADKSKLVSWLKTLKSASDKPMLLSLGNHDFHELIALARECKLIVLFNEKVLYDQICIHGIDDTAFYQTHEFTEPEASHFNLLLSHDPEVVLDPRIKTYDFILSGHTHAGQICLIKHRPLMNLTKTQKNLIYGAWSYKVNQTVFRGFTSAGLGSSGARIRFNCPPEIVLHHLLPEKTN